MTSHPSFSEGLSNRRPSRALGFAGVLGGAVNVMAQALKDVQIADKPLTLKAQGSFFVGGDKVQQTQGELGDLGPGGHITVNQMYVRYMVPQEGNNPPVVMVHGATLTGKSWETTPDGRIGWDESFVRGGTRSTCPTRWAAGNRDSIQRYSTMCEPGSFTSGQPPSLAALQRRGCLAELPHRSQGRTALARIHSSP